MLLPSLYTNSFLNDTIRAFHCPDFMVAQLVPEMCFWLVNSRKNLNFLRCIQVSDPVLECCSDTEDQIGYTIYYFLVLVKILYCFSDWQFFSYVGQVSDWDFLVWRFYWKVWYWVLKLIWSRRYWVLVFLLDCPSFRCRRICMDEELPKMLKSLALLTSRNCFDNWFEWYIVLYFKCACTV